MFCHTIRQRRALKEDELRSGVRFSLPLLSADKHLLTSRPQLPRNKSLKLDEEIVCALGDDISQVTNIS